jgi:hypothetical protein
MTRRGLRRPGIVITELLTVIVIGLAVSGIVATLIIDSIYLQRSGAERLDRAAVRASLTGHLRDDANQAADYTWDGRTLRLRASSAGQAPEEIAYEIDEAEVVRLAAGAQTDGWHGPRLSFCAKILSGRAGDLLCLDCTDTPPPRAAGLPRRTFTYTFALPKATGPQPAPVEKPELKETDRAGGEP